jgi:hypothetical protein
VAHGYTAAEAASSYLAVENAKKIVRALGGNESLIGTHDVALAHIDASLGSGADKTAAQTKLDKLGHKHA